MDPLPLETSTRLALDCTASPIVVHLTTRSSQHAAWGWPASHPTTAFALAVTIYRLLPKQRWLGCLAIAYAFYIGFGVSMTIHWFSDFVAGALVGTSVGLVVGASFSQRQM